MCVCVYGTKKTVSELYGGTQLSILNRLECIWVVIITKLLRKFEKCLMLNYDSDENDGSSGAADGTHCNVWLEETVIVER